VHIDVAEAITLLEGWAADKTTLRVCFSRPGTSREANGHITGIKGKTVKLDTDSGAMEISLYDAEFNGDRRAPANSPYGAYLICDFRNDNRWTFYAPRPPSIEKPAIERRTL
jgi:hypothetical protein